MAQEYIKINDIVIFQPDEGLSYDFETTFDENTTRVQTGTMYGSPMFTVEAFGYEATDIPVSEASKILKQVAKGNFFKLHYFSIYHNEWRDGEFRVGKGSMSIGRLIEGEERLESLSFNMTGRDPID